MLVITYNEYQNMKIYEMENKLYNRIEKAFSRILGDKAKILLEKHMNKTIRELSLNNYVNILDCFTII